MARYIDAEKIDFSCLKDDFDRARAAVIIMGQPAADVVEVCRCKECANGYHKTDISVMCKIWNRLMITEDYCSYGAKMDGKECNK